MSHLNKVLLFIVFLAIFVCFAITGRGQSTTGFQLSGPLTFGGFHNGTPVWNVGSEKALSLIVAGVPLHKHLADLEGKRVRITIEPTN